MDSFIGWIGGKKLLRGAVCERFPADIGRYIEVFGGAGWVLFHKEKHANFEVYNDINGGLVNLFRCVKHHPDALMSEMEFMLNSRELFDCYKSHDNTGLTDIQRAARFLYIIRASYGCKLTSFGAKPRDVTKLDGLREIQKRLAKVVIENKSFEQLIPQYDRPDALFYCDPPYYKAERLYDKQYYVFDEAAHLRLKDVLSAVKGRFILSYNDCEFIRGLYSEYNIKQCVRHSNLASATGKGKTYNELIITNY